MKTKKGIYLLAQRGFVLLVLVALVVVLLVLAPTLDLRTTTRTRVNNNEIEEPGDRRRRGEKCGPQIVAFIRSDVNVGKLVP